MGGFEHLTSSITMRRIQIQELIGRPVEVQGIIFARTENGRIVEDWTLVDEMDILQQLGLVPPS
jgi:predicted ester cyclase